MAEGEARPTAPRRTRDDLVTDLPKELPAHALAANTAGAASATHAALAWPREHFVGDASALKLGMWVFLLADAFSFGGLLLGYGVLRAGAEVWWRAGEPALGIAFTAGLTFLLICSSVTMALAVAAGREGKRGQTLVMLGLTMLGGLLFLAGQGREYFGLAAEPGLLASGLAFTGSHRAATFYVVTSFHAAHVFTGVVLIAITFVRVAMGGLARRGADGLETIGLFWHFVDLVWILVFTFLYLLPSTPPGGPLP
jgi:cytochrome c oxidase subunit 3